MSGIWTVRRQSTRIPGNLLRAGAIGVAVIGTVGLVLAAGTANADPAPEPRLIEGNVATCDAAGLTGSILFGSEPDYGPNPAAGSGTITGQTLDVTINAGFTATGVVVKGGPDTNVYDGPFVGPVTIEGMVAPPNESGNTPDISHWFVCGDETPPSPSPSESPSPSPSPSLSPSPSPTLSPTPSPTSTPTAVPAPTPSASVPPVPPLPVTGFPVMALVGIGAGLSAAGLALVLRRRTATP